MAIPIIAMRHAARLVHAVRYIWTMTAVWRNVYIPWRGRRLRLSRPQSRSPACQRAA